MPKYLRVLVVVGAFAFNAGPASAGSQSSSVSVTASIAQACTTLTPSSSTITFPAYDAFGNSSTPDDATVAQFTTQCTKGASGVNFSVSGGLNCTHASGLRSMKTASNTFLNYNLYQDTGHSTLWPFNTTTCAALAGPTLTINGSTDTQTLSIYGRIPAGQDPTVGNNYTDTVTVAVNF
jgi:spore coat protein U-like protein